MKAKRIDWISLFVIFMNIIATSMISRGLPDKIPMHWNAAGQIDRYGAKGEILTLAFVPLLLYVILFALTFLDKRLEERLGAYHMITRSTVLVVLVIQYSTIASAWGYKVEIGKVMLAAVGLMMIIMGNYLPQLKQNSVAGIRLPWTLKDEDTWRAVHRVGGYWTVGMGVLFILLSFIMPNSIAIIFMLAAIISWSIALTVYSYVYYKKSTASR